MLITFSKALCCLGLSVLLSASAASAGTIDIQFTGLHLSYDGTNISDIAVGADPLTTVSIEEDGVPIAGSPFVSDIGLDLMVPGVTNIAVGGDTVMSATGGMIDLELPSGSFLNLDLGTVTLTYLDLGIVNFAFAGSVASIDTQSLPAGLVIGDPVNVSFAATISSLTDDGANLTSFEATGTGSVEGATVPEPSSIALLGMLTVAAAAGSRRS